MKFGASARWLLRVGGGLLFSAQASAADQTGPLAPFSQCTPDLPHQKSDAVYRICTPPPWWRSNGELVIWAHGYVDETRPVEIPEDQNCVTDSLCIQDVVNFLGYDFATTSYSVNGLAVLPGIQDVIELVDLYTAREGPPALVYLVGASEGGLITTLAAERHPEVFDGGLALCGPIGDFRAQVDYFGDFRAVFDYFFPDLIPGSAVEVPPILMEIWDPYYDRVVRPTVFDPENRDALAQLLLVSDAAFDPDDLAVSVETTVSDLTWYSVFATNNAFEVLGGQSFDNTRRLYRGSRNDRALNVGIERFPADAAALEEIENHYQTSGVLDVPLVTLHTTLDQQVPAWHELLYLEKTRASGAWPEKHFLHPPTVGYGHCLFRVGDVISAFDKLVEMVEGTAIDERHIEQLFERLGSRNRVVPFHRYPRP